MNNVKVYKIFYYLSAVITFVLVLLTSIKTSSLYSLYSNYDHVQSMNISHPFLGVINLGLVILFSILLVKKTLKNVNIIVPVIYLLFMLTMKF